MAATVEAGPRAVKRRCTHANGAGVPECRWRQGPLPGACGPSIALTVMKHVTREKSPEGGITSTGRIDLYGLCRCQFLSCCRHGPRRGLRASATGRDRGVPACGQSATGNRKGVRRGTPHRAAYDPRARGLLFQCREPHACATLQALVAAGRGSKLWNRTGYAIPFPGIAGRTYPPCPSRLAEPVAADHLLAACSVRIRLRASRSSDTLCPFIATPHRRRAEGSPPAEAPAHYLRHNRASPNSRNRLLGKECRFLDHHLSRRQTTRGDRAIYHVRIGPGHMWRHTCPPSPKASGRCVPRTASRPTNLLMAAPP
ncbi:hypothetical protein EV216_1461 [Rhodovulum steppense]|uniref:Uncharacterized protein n=1 Tax=Rhodovulum steppense TaxID=540251 RepID=A0A4R1YFL0_9RHOB|nr:hypothetical protein EV216_1461 [Rhodovulum steppense]